MRGARRNRIDRRSRVSLPPPFQLAFPIGRSIRKSLKKIKNRTPSYKNIDGEDNEPLYEEIEQLLAAGPVPGAAGGGGGNAAAVANHVRHRHTEGPGLSDPGAADTTFPGPSSGKRPSGKQPRREEAPSHAHQHQDNPYAGDAEPSCADWAGAGVVYAQHPAPGPVRSRKRAVKFFGWAFFLISSG